ncbi:hypothetical protein L596_005822 [Steinernema carpocapsae]|uniref:Uncharacterized protein n=1 Tax=Steinernema carpocapsae TaxID=34508 RepID=A0A4V6YSZ3_STECR|nr:hypothetical protein L596_005822 [Steinernema carpocapsae]
MNNSAVATQSVGASTVATTIIQTTVRSIQTVAGITVAALSTKTPAGLATTAKTTVKPTTMDPKVETGHAHMLYASMFTFSVITILMLIYMSVFGRRVRMSGWIFHTINFSAWNMVQLVNFASTSIGTPLPDFVKNQGFVGRMKEIQAGTLTMFAAGMIFVLPYTMLCYAFPQSLKSHLLSWVAWIPIIVGINFSAIFLFTKKDLKNLFQANPIDGHMFYANMIFLLFFLWFVMGVILAVLVYLSKLGIYISHRMSKQPSDIPIGALTTDLINLILVIPYSFIIWFLALFPNVLSFAAYMMSVLHLNINILLEFAKYLPAFFMDWAMQLIKYQEYLQLFLPCAQFILTCTMIPYYREQAMFLMSCGYFYSKTDVYLQMPDKGKKLLESGILRKKSGQTAPTPAPANNGVTKTLVQYIGGQNAT